MSRLNQEKKKEIAMTDETTRDAKKSKKVDKRIGPTKYGKNPLKFDKVNERVLPKNKELSKTFFMLHHFLIKFINNESKVPPNFFKELKHKVSGYVLMLLLVTLPVILLGTKYVLDQMSTDQAKIDKGSETYHKRCAREAALAVAKNWNPGLTLEQQQAAVYKVADAVYDDSPCYNDSVVGRAIPGLDVKKSHKSTKIGSKFNPIKVTYAEVASKKTIGYTTSTKYLNRRYYYMYDGGTTWNPNWALWRSIDAVTSPGYRESRFDEINASERKKVNYILDHHDIYGMPSIAYNGHICKLYNGVYYPNDTYHSPACCSDHSRFVISALNTSSNLNNYSPINIGSGISYSNYSSTASTYTVRTPSYDSGSVKISIESDQIKVETDSNIVNSSSTVAKAVPAECNVDIVLAIPVNGAANNADNRDAASDTAGTPVSDATATTSIPTSITNTPIYQMGQACKDFVKKFYHTRGVYMSLIPYSGKLSLSPDRASAWTTPIPTFNSSSTDIQMLIGSCLYGTKGTKDAKLTQSTKNYSSTAYYWGNVLTGCPIMCRRGTQYIGYGSNCYHGGLLLNTTTPNNSDYSYKYMRMNLNPCYIGYANTLAMKCEKQCTHYLPNPYYMIEPTADLVKIYEMCNALYPIYDTYNVSNFVFAALEWANNMFQSWTTDPGVSTTEGTGGSAVLARQSKTTSDRKKAVVLLINKPDWFEPGEMTYLGFNNDYSEVPVVESDKIDFSINYSDTSKAFLDGTAYNGTYRGQKQILTMEKQSGDDLTRTNGFYECGQGKYRLKFPQKGLIKIVAKPLSTSRWNSFGSAHQKGFGNYNGHFYDSVCYGNGKLYYCRNNSYYHPHIVSYTIATDTWQALPARYTGDISGHNATYWVSLSYYGDTLYTSHYNGPNKGGEIWAYDTIMDTFKNMFQPKKTEQWSVLLYNNTLYACGAHSYLHSVTSQYANHHLSISADTTSRNIGNGSNTDQSYGGRNRSLCALGDRIYFISNFTTGEIKYWDLATKSVGTLATTMNSVCSESQCCYSMCILNGKIYTVSAGTGSIYSCNLSGDKWVKIASSGNDICGVTENWQSICTDNEKLFVSSFRYGYTASYEFEKKGALQFTYGVSNDTTYHEFEEQTEFVVEPWQLTDTSSGSYYIDFQINNVALVSAEITNRPYRVVPSICSIEGTETAPYIQTNTLKSILVTLTTKEQKPAHITFYGDNGVEQNLGRWPVLSEGRTFTFTGGQDPSGGLTNCSSTLGVNFAHNLSLYKVRYSCENCYISSATLTDQWIRDYIGQYGRKQPDYKPLILSDGTLGVKNSNNDHYSVFSTFYNVEGQFEIDSDEFNQIISYLPNFRDPCYSVLNISKLQNTDSTGTEYQNPTTGYGSGYRCIPYGAEGICKFCVVGKGKRTWVYQSFDNSEVGSSLSESIWSNYDVHLSLNGVIAFARSNYVLQHYTKNGVSKTLQSLIEYPRLSDVPGTGLTRNEGIYLVKLQNNLSNKIVAGNYICFNGDGDLSVTVVPDGSLDTRTSTMTITPNTYTYSKQSNGNYYIYLTGIKKSMLSNVRFCDSGKSIVYEKIRLPARSSVVDYSRVSEAKPVYNSDLVQCTVGPSTVYDSNIGYWVAGEGGNDFWDMQMYSKNDFYLSLEEHNDGSTSRLRRLWYGNGSNDSYNKRISNKYFPGLSRLFFKASEYWPKFGLGWSGTHALMFEGFTQPINTILYEYGVGKNSSMATTDNYVNPTNDFNRTVLKQLTTEACAKLKNAKARVYVVKYKHQENWNEITRSTSLTYTNEATAHSYTEIENCATSSGGFVREASNESDLKAKLDEIATNIKSSGFANYQEATLK